MNFPKRVHGAIHVWVLKSLRSASPSKGGSCRRICSSCAHFFSKLSARIENSNAKYPPRELLESFLCRFDLRNLSGLSLVKLAGGGIEKKAVHNGRSSTCFRIVDLRFDF